MHDPTRLLHPLALVPGHCPTGALLRQVWFDAAVRPRISTLGQSRAAAAPPDEQLPDVTHHNVAAQARRSRFVASSTVIGTAGPPARSSSGELFSTLDDAGIDALL
jgi:hypothetical protein